MPEETREPVKQDATTTEPADQPRDMPGRALAAAEPAPGSRISRVQAAWVRMPIEAGFQHVSDFGRLRTFDTAVIRIETDDGMVGYGEARNAAGSAGTYAALVAAVNHELAPELIGLDPRNVVAIWDRMYNGTRAGYAADRGHVFPVLGRRGIAVAAMSGVDIALWDILAKSLGVPLWQVLGGRKATHLPAYASGGWADVEGIGAQLAGYVETGGFRSVKMRVGAMDGTVRRSAARVEAARKALGPEVALMCDAHGTFTVAEAKHFCHLVRDLDVAWFEEPVTGDDKQGMGEVRASTHIPIAAGESEYTRFDFRDLVEHRAVDILQPDLAVCGGITEGLRIGGLAAAHNLRMAPHLWAGAPAFAAGLHFCAASASSFVVEYSLGANPMLHDLVEEDFLVCDGMVEVPDRPGLGVTVREDVVEAYTVEV
ncbi:mandelate racemase/muconate lactonizing enzyme family protein [Actinopolymorpha sp. B17G11]|uniref:mandelate racemase/muconate lactonizing enzyme family protein n=1 Tax=Actinopolymorpha sp. B17G11 TaxID=3160861 RepID=UPI0032E51C9C